MKRIEIILSGSGGQGLILAGIILAQAALTAGWQVVQTQSYGPEARGGASRSEVIISNEEIAYPRVEQADFLLAMNQEACAKYISAVKKTGLVLVDSTFVTRLPATTTKIISLPITKTVRERLGKTFVANMAALGALVAFLTEISPVVVEQALVERVPAGTEEVNREAFRLGIELVATRVAADRDRFTHFSISPGNEWAGL